MISTIHKSLGIFPTFHSVQSCRVIRESKPISIGHQKVINCQIHWILN